MSKKDKKSYMAYDCPYNEGCACHRMECHRCGWNPKVHKERLEKILKGKVGS